MDTFGFIIHPLDAKRDVSRKFPLLGRLLTERQIHFLSTFFPPIYLSQIQGVTSAADGHEIGGWLLACPLTSTRMSELPVRAVYRKIIQTGRLAEKLGAKILGLGALTAVIGDEGLTIARALKIPVTTGDSYTVATALEALRKAAALMNIPLYGVTAAIVGATGSIGSVSAEILADEVRRLVLVGRHPDRLQRLRDRIVGRGALAEITVETRLEALREAHLVLSVTSAIGSVLQPEILRPGSVVCDVAQPRDVSPRVAENRGDVLVVDGGTIEIPGNVDFHFDFGLPPGQGYACMAETMALTLEGRFESYSLGKRISRHQVEEISCIAHKHGFRLSGFRSFEKPVTEQHLDTVRDHAAKQFAFER